MVDKKKKHKREFYITLPKYCLVKNTTNKFKFIHFDLTQEKMIRILDQQFFTTLNMDNIPKIVFEIEIF